MIDEIGYWAIKICRGALMLVCCAALIGLAISFVVALFAIPVWVVCSIFGLAFEWKWVAFAAFMICATGAIFSKAEY